MNGNIFPTIKTRRLLLRKIKESETNIILFLRSDEGINKYIIRPESRKTKTLEDALNHIKSINKGFENNESITWGIALDKDSPLIGSICLWNYSNNNTTAEVGYDLVPTFQNNGIMNEALIHVIEYGFTKMGFEKIEAYTHKDNEHSIRLLEKNGFNLAADKIDGNNSKNLVFELFNAD